jgi:glutamine phosphoribosylpyrophosphate amidotransferase
MCAILGCYLESPNQKQIETIKELFVQSQIRGKHATGVSVLQDEKIVTRKEPVPANVFVEDHLQEIQAGDHILQLIGHCRYSTSDLRFNQPIQEFDDMALAHNGVVTQEPVYLWKRFGYELRSTNDSELLYQAAHSGKEPLLEFPTATMAVAELSVRQGLRWYRNGGRPLYYVKVANGYFICSTQDIAIRSGLTKAKRCKTGTIYTVKGNTKLTTIEEQIP